MAGGGGGADVAGVVVELEHPFRIIMKMNKTEMKTTNTLVIAFTPST